MNVKPYSILFFFISSIIFIQLPSCNKECRMTHEKLLTEQQKKQIPFEGKEIITFKSGQSVIELIGTGRIDTLEKIYPSGFSCDYYIEESEFLTFESEDYQLNIRMRARDYFYLKLYDFIEDLKMSAYLRSAPSTGEISEYTEFIDSITVNNLQYLNIYKDTVSNVYPLNTREFSRYAIYFYYSTEYGVIKIDFSDSTSWELEHIEW